jgi:hypothetical protein
MKGKALVNLLEEDEFSIEIGAATRTQWQKKSEISPTILRNAFRKLQYQTIERAIRPIIEFHGFDFFHDANVDSLKSRRNDDDVLYSAP